MLPQRGIEGHILATFRDLVLAQADTGAPRRGEACDEGQGQADDGLTHDELRGGAAKPLGLKVSLSNRPKGSNYFKHFG